MGYGQQNWMNVTGELIGEDRESQIQIWGGGGGG